MSEEISLATSHNGAFFNDPSTQPDVGPSREKIVFNILGGIIGGVLLCCLGFLGLVTYVSLKSPASNKPVLACPPICKVEAR